MVGWVCSKRFITVVFQTCEPRIKETTRVEGGKKKRLLCLPLRLAWKLELPLPVLHCAGKICYISQYWQVMDGTVADGRKIIHTEFRRFTDALKFALSLN